MHACRVALTPRPTIGAGKVSPGERAVAQRLRADKRLDMSAIPPRAPVKNDGSRYLPDDDPHQQPGRITAPENSPKADREQVQVRSAVELGSLRFWPRGVAAAERLDSVVSGVSIGVLSQPRTLSTTAFGSERFAVSFVKKKYEFADNKCTVSAGLDVIAEWGTNSRGRTDVPSGTDAIVTANTWKAIKSDLEPRKTSPHSSKRTKYYSEALVEQHEKFHGTDDYKWTESSGISVVKSVLEKGTASAATADRDVSLLLANARAALMTANTKYYKGSGTGHDTYAGEIRAYADGKPKYEKLANDVAAQGKKLEATAER
jgi:hypothetical protein